MRDALRGPNPRAVARDLSVHPDPLAGLRSLLRELPAAELAGILHALRDHSHPMLGWKPVRLKAGGRVVSLDLLVPPGVFDPGDEWSTTFLEGLLRKSPDAYQGKRLIDVGTGSGWVPLALLLLTELDSALGVDLNPRAVLVARLNAILNSFGPDGQPLAGALASRFSSQVSDLLAEPRRTGVRTDLVIGCLPQVIASSNDCDLNDYAPAQGVAEDEFGLGLNARLLRESREVLRPGGSVILNLAGRPGPTTLHAMFLRAGFEPEVLWLRRIRQTPDTDITSLAELERLSDHVFSFYLHHRSTQAVPARIAVDRRAAQLPVYHELQVIEGSARSASLFPLAAELTRGGMTGLMEDLATEEADDALDEQLRFAAVLARRLATAPVAPYPHERGDLPFRGRVTEFLGRFHDVALAADDVFVAPNRAELLHAMLMSIADRGDRVVLSNQLRATLQSATVKAEVDAIWLHDDAAEIAELLPRLRPRLVMLAHCDAGIDYLHRLCQEQGALLVLDESSRFTIGDAGPVSPGLRLLSRHPNDGHLAVVLGLTGGKAFPETELALLLSHHADLMQGMSTAAELTWSRISCFDQFCFQHRFDELLGLPVGGPRSGLPPRRPGPALTARMRALLRAPAFARPEPDPTVIRLDYGENELPLPEILRVGIVRGFLPRNGHGTERRTARAVANYVRATRLPGLRDDQITLGAGTLPLVFDALLATRHRLGRPPVVALPIGSYGLFAPLAQAAGATVRHIPSDPPDFLATPDTVAAAQPYDVLLLADPANPSGASYDPGQLRELVRLTANRGAKVILDEVFGLLRRLDGPLSLGQDRWAGMNTDERECLLLLGGLSKEFAAGGLRLGFAATADPQWQAQLRDLRLSLPPISARIAAEQLFANLSQLWPEVTDLRRQLRDRRDLLAKGLTELGFGLAGADRGGMFLHPDLTRVTDDPEKFVLDLERRAGVRLNPPSWSGAVGHARACYSIPENHIHEALHRMRAPARENHEK